MKHAPIGRWMNDPSANIGHRWVTSADDELAALTSLVDDFANAVRTKLHSQIGKRGGWADPDWTEDEIRRRMADAVLKGDPIDVAAFAAFLWNRCAP